MTLITILLALELAFMVWRDLDCRAFRQDIKFLEDRFQTNVRTLSDNADNARRDALFWRSQYENLAAERSSDTGAVTEGKKTE